MNILILGGSGFIGTNLIRYISKKDPSINITSTSVSSSKPHVKLDILNSQDLAKAVRGQDVIINLAGLSGAVETGKNPQKTIETNTLGHLHILQAAKDYNPNALVIFASSRLEYGAVDELPVTEESELTPETSYGISKYTATKYSLLFHKLYGLKTVVLRMSNPFGPQKLQNHSHYNIVNNFIGLAMNNKELTIYGNGNQQRDYIYIDDVLDAFWRTIQSKEAVGKVLNIGSGNPLKVVEIAKIIIKKLGKGSIAKKPWPEEWKRIETGDFYFDNTFSKKILKWNPKTPIEKAIDLTIQNYA